MSGAEERKASASRLYDEIAAEYDQVGPPFFARRGVELVSRVGIGAGWRVLDAGCGRGACLFPAAEAVWAAGSVVGIDVSGGMVEETRAEVRQRGLTNVTVDVGDAEEPAFGDSEFDAVLSGFVLRQLPDPAAALRSYHRVLRPGGRLGVNYYASGFAGEWEAVADALEPYVGAGRDARSQQKTESQSDELDSVGGLSGLLRGAGFGSVEVADEPQVIELPDVDEWWEYLWHSGYRGTMKRIPPADRDDARRAAAEAARGLSEPDGRVLMRVLVRVALAARPLGEEGG